MHVGRPLEDLASVIPVVAHEPLADQFGQVDVSAAGHHLLDALLIRLAVLGPFLP